MSSIELQQVSKRWGNTVAMRQISLTAEAGKFLVLLGPSGCGKSTTLRVMAGLEAVTSGRVLIAGKDVTHRPPAARKVSMVFQSYALFPHLNTREAWWPTSKRNIRISRSRRSMPVTTTMRVSRPWLLSKAVNRRSCP